MQRAKLNKILYRMLCLGTAVCLVIFLGACAPGLGSSVTIGEIFPEELPVRHILPHSIPVQLTSVEDARRSRITARIEDRVLVSRQTPAVLVQRSLRSLLESRGFIVSTFSDARIVVEIYQWEVTVSSNFPRSGAEAIATIVSVVLGPEGSLVYRGEYQGHALIKSPMLRQSQVENLLGETMAEALKAMLEDAGFIDAILSLSSTPPDEHLQTGAELG